MLNTLSRFLTFEVLGGFVTLGGCVETANTVGPSCEQKNIVAGADEKSEQQEAFIFSFTLSPFSKLCKLKVSEFGLLTLAVAN